MAAPSTPAFDAAIARSLRAVGADASARAVDPLGDPAGATRALEAQDGAPLLLRVAPALGAPSGAEARAHAPPPSDPVWLRLTRGARALQIAPLRLDGAPDGGAVGLREAVRVVVTAQRRPCCDAAACSRERAHVTAWLVLAPDPASDAAPGRGCAPEERLLVAEAHDLDDARAGGLVEAVAAPLARALGVPLETAGGVEPPDAIAARPFPEPAPDPAPPLTAAALARFAVRSEGDLLVLRDLESLGPRASASRDGLVGVGLVLVALALWIATMQRACAGDVNVAIGVGSAAALLSIAGYAFLGVARFSSRYVARSAPLASFSRDRFVVAPWVSPTGAIDLRPEGRLGAAIPLGELHGVHVRPRDGGFAVELDTDHGALDALVTGSEEVARYWSGVLVRVAASVRHPGGPSAKQRLRSRAQEQAAGAGARAVG